MMVFWHHSHSLKACLHLLDNGVVSPSTVVGIIDRLEEKQFVKRTRDVIDRRAVFVEITDKGKEFVATAPHSLHNQLYQGITNLAESEQILIANSLGMLVYLFEEK